MRQSLSKNTDQPSNNDSNSNELIERIPIENTPFTAIRYDQKWFLTMGKYRLTEPMESFEQVKEDAERADWNRVIQIITIVFDTNFEMMQKPGGHLLGKKHQEIKPIDDTNTNFTIDQLKPQ